MIVGCLKADRMHLPLGGSFIVTYWMMTYDLQVEDRRVLLRTVGTLERMLGKYAEQKGMPKYEKLCSLIESS